MSHQSSHIIVPSLLHIFDPDEYEGVREHFSPTQLERIDAMRALPEDYEFSLRDKLFVSRMIDKAIFTGED